MNGLAAQYAKHHLIGRDCRLTAMRNTFSFYGAVETYPAMFGLSATFGFGFRDRPFDDHERASAPDCDTTEFYYPIVGNRLDCIGGLAQTFGATLQRRVNDDEEESFQDVAGHLNEGRPVMMAVSRAFLNRSTGRAAQELEVLPEISFGGHWVVLTEADQRAGTVTFFEPDLEDPLTVDEQTFRAARTWGDDDPRCFVKSRAAWAVCVPPAARAPRASLLRVACAEILRHASEQDAGNPHASLRVLHEFAASLPGLRSGATLSLRKLKATVVMLRFQGQLLAGGGLGRRLFANFLRQGARDTKSAAVGEAQRQCGQMAQLWDALIDQLYVDVVEGRTTDLAMVPGLQSRLEQIVAGETALFAHLGSFVQEAVCC